MTIIGSCQKEEIADEILPVQEQKQGVAIEFSESCKSDVIFASTTLDSPSRGCWDYGAYSDTPGPLVIISGDGPPGFGTWPLVFRDAYEASLITDTFLATSRLRLQSFRDGFDSPPISFVVKLTYQEWNNNSWANINATTENWSTEEHPSSFEFNRSMQLSPYGPVAPGAKLRVIAEIWIDGTSNTGKNIILEFNKNKEPIFPKNR